MEKFATRELTTMHGQLRCHVLASAGRSSSNFTSIWKFAGSFKISKRKSQGGLLKLVTVATCCRSMSDIINLQSSCVRGNDQMWPVESDEFMAD